MEYQRNTSGTPQNSDCIIFKRKFKPQNLNFQLRFETFFIADINYLLIYLRLVYT